MESQGITKVIRIHPVGPTFHVSPFDCCQEIPVKTKNVNLMLALEKRSYFMEIILIVLRYFSLDWETNRLTIQYPTKKERKQKTKHIILGILPIQDRIRLETVFQIEKVMICRSSMLNCWYNYILKNRFGFFQVCHNLILKCHYVSSKCYGLL